MYSVTHAESSSSDGFHFQLGPDTFYITLEDQKKAESLESEGLTRPIKISATKTTTVYFAVPGDQHWAPVCLRLSPFALGHVPGQVFYCIYLQYLEWCHPDLGAESIINGVQRVYRVYFAAGPCDFNEDK